MSTQSYLVEIFRESLTDYEGRVRDEEAGGAQFNGNSVAVFEGRITNLTSFEVLPPGQVLNEPTFVPAEQVPTGLQAAWTGVVLIGNANVAVSMLR